MPPRNQESQILSYFRAGLNQTGPKFGFELEGDRPHHSKLCSSPSDSKLASWASGGGENGGLQCSGPRGHPHRPLGHARCPMPGRVSFFRILKGDTRKASDPAVTPWMGLDARLLEGIGGQRTCIRSKASTRSQGIEALPTSVWAKAFKRRQGIDALPTPVWAKASTRRQSIEALSTSVLG